MSADHSHGSATIAATATAFPPYVLTRQNVKTYMRTVFDVGERRLDAIISGVLFGFCRSALKCGTLTLWRLRRAYRVVVTRPAVTVRLGRQLLAHASAMFRMFQGGAAAGMHDLSLDEAVITGCA
jgi:hypothetical protein